MFDRNQTFFCKRMNRRVPVLWGLWMSLVVLGSFAELIAQMPPEILVDSYLLQVDKRMDEKDPAGALEALQKIIALREEHELTEPVEFHYKYALVAFAAESMQTAQESVKEYLTVAGRDGEFYRKALELSIKLGAFAQLTPEILFDQYQLQAEQKITQKDHEGALKSLQKILDLQNDNGLTLPEAFHFKYAQVTFSVGRLGAALESLNQYLVAAGRDGEFYREALLLLDRVQRIQPLLDQYPDSVEQLVAKNDYGAAIALMDEILETQKEHDFTLPKGFHSKYAEVRIAGAEPKCMGQTQDGKCWMELENQSECYVWFPWFSDHYIFLPRPMFESVTWTAGCSGGLAQGMGELRWVADSGKFKFLFETTGRLRQGKANGNWVEKLFDMRRRGVRRLVGGTKEGSYVEGKKHGLWAWGESNGVFKDDKKHGFWVEDSGYRKGSYVEGKRHGVWTITDRHLGIVGGGTYVEGKKYGDWVEHRLDETAEGPYAEGLRHGRWKITDYEYRHAYLQGYNHGYAGPTHIQHGWYEAGKKTGIWKFEQIWNQPWPKVKCYEKWTATYVDDKFHGEHTYQNTNCDCYRNVYDRGNRVSYKKVRKKICRRELD